MSSSKPLSIGGALNVLEKPLVVRWSNAEICKGCAWLSSGPDGCLVINWAIALSKVGINGDGKGGKGGGIRGLIIGELEVLVQKLGVKALGFMKDNCQGIRVLILIMEESAGTMEPLRTAGLWCVCWPSYVVTTSEGSSEHRSTLFFTKHLLLVHL